MCPLDCFEERIDSTTNFFSNFEREFYWNLTDFFPAISQKCYLCLRKRFWGKDKIWEILVSFATNSRLEGQFWILHVQKTKNISVYKLFIFLGRQLFRFSANFLWHSCQTCNQCERKSFPTKRYSLRKLVVCIPNFRVWAEDIWIFVGFLSGLSKLHSACAEA